MYLTGGSGAPDLNRTTFLCLFFALFYAFSHFFCALRARIRIFFAFFALRATPNRAQHGRILVRFRCGLGTIWVRFGVRFDPIKSDPSQIGLQSDPLQIGHE